MSHKSENAEASNEGRLDLDMLGVVAAEEVSQQPVSWCLK